MRPRQTILLGLLLLVPVLAFLFLYGFGRNQYALPTYLPERADSVRLAAGGWQRDTVFHRVRPFQLPGANGRRVALSELTQGLCVLQVLTAAPAATPPAPRTPAAADAKAMQVLARMQEHFRREPRVRLATLVPDADAAKAAAGPILEKLSEQYGTISGKWLMLAAPADTLAQLARYELGLTALRPGHLPFRPATEPGNLPAGRLLLLDRAGHVRGYYDGTDVHEVERLLTEINVLLYIYDHNR